jgi:hypothetical protein
LPAGGSTAASPTPSASTSGAADPVLAGYLAYWGAVIHAHAVANANDPLLAQHATGGALAYIRGNITRNRTQQLSVRGTVTHQARVVAAAGDSATIDDCFDTTDWQAVDIKTGKPIGAIPDNGTGRYRERVTMRQISGNWLAVAIKDTGSC